MSSLRYPPNGMGGFSFEDLFIPWKSEQEDRSERVARSEARRDAAQQAQLSTTERAEAAAIEQEQLRFQALLDLQVRVASKLKLLEEQAEVGMGVVLKIRELATDPILRGDSFLADLELSLSDLETAVISIQAGTVADATSFDSAILAESLSRATAALIAMRTVASRALGVKKSVEVRLQEIRAERVRLQLAREEAEASRAVAERRDRQLAEQRRAEEDSRTAEAERKRRRNLMQQILAVQGELGAEKRRLAAARTELGNLKFAQAERRVRVQAGAMSGWRR